MKKNVVILGSNKKICEKLKKQLLVIGTCAEMKILPVSHLDVFMSKVAEISERSIILVFKNEELKEATEVLHNYKIMELYVFPWDTHHFGNDNDVIGNLIPIDNIKPRLDYLEIEVNEGCNLNCKGCNEFSNLIDKHKHGNLESVRKDLEKLKELFWGIGKIRLMGGEPLVNPEFPQFVRAAREIFPDSDIRLLSNGLLIPKLPQDDLTEVKKHNCSFDISVYPPTKQILHTITRRLDDFGISYNLTLLNKYFFKTLLQEPTDSPDKAFKNCLFTHCHAMSEGYLSACSNQMYAYRLNAAFNLNFPENEKINIHTTTLNGWEIDQIFMKPHEFCKYCGKGMIPFKWKTSLRNEVKKGDWLIEPTFVNMKIMPLIQKIAKSPAKHLRSKIRSPKGQQKKNNRFL